MPQTVPQMEAGGVSGGQLLWSADGGRKPASSQRPELDAGTGSQRRAERTGRLACLALGAVNLRAGIGEGRVRVAATDDGGTRSVQDREAPSAPG